MTSSRLKKLVSRLFSSRQEKSASPALPAAPSAPKWTSEDRDQFVKFLTSITGRKLLARLRATECVNAIAACKEKNDTKYTAGRAAGYGEAIKHLESLAISFAPDASEQNDRVANGQRLNPETRDETEAREMRELLERISP